MTPNEIVVGMMLLIKHAHRVETEGDMLVVAVEAADLQDKIISHIDRLGGLLHRADSELNDMTELDCPEFVERDEDLQKEIEEILNDE